MDNLDFNIFCQQCSESREYRRENCFTKYRVREYKQGEYITYKGDIANELSILVKGGVKTELLLDSGIYYTSTIHKAPYAIGALAIFANNRAYKADIVAIDDCNIISVHRDDIEDQMVKCRIFMRNFIAYNMDKIDMFTNHITILTQRGLNAKLALYIFTIANNGEFKFNKTIDALATYLAVERPSLSRAISQLKRMGVITYNRGEGKILDVSTLKNMME